MLFASSVYRTGTTAVHAPREPRPRVETKGGFHPTTSEAIQLFSYTSRLSFRALSVCPRITRSPTSVADLICRNPIAARIYATTLGCNTVVMWIYLWPGRPAQISSGELTPPSFPLSALTSFGGFWPDDDKYFPSHNLFQCANPTRGAPRTPTPDRPWRCTISFRISCPAAVGDSYI